MQWFVAMTSSAMYFILLLSFAAVYTGLCFYITGMVDDLKAQIHKVSAILDRDETKQRTYKTDIWLKYVKEIEFHNDIVE